MQASEESHIVAIIRRNDEGLLERCEQACVDSDESVTLIDVPGGLAAVIGPICETDASAIETIAREELSDGFVGRTSTSFAIQENS